MSDLRNHEPDTTSVLIMSLSAAGLLALLFGGVTVVGIGFRFLVPTVPIVSADSEAAKQQMIPGVQPNQKFERLQLQKDERRILNEFMWQDKEKTIARIPIEQAIQLMAKRVLQTDWPASDATLPAELPTKEQP